MKMTKDGRNIYAKLKLFPNEKVINLGLETGNGKLKNR